MVAVAPPEQPSLEIQHLWKVFGPGPHQRALSMADQGASRADILADTGQTIGVRDVTFSVARGETFVVMGLSGSGKSTLIRCIARLIEPSSGRVLVDGADLLAMDADGLRHLRRTKMSMVFQHFGLFPHRRVVDNVAYGLEVQGIARAERRRRANDILQVVGLEGWGQHYPQQLSGGMQQRVGLARALALDPEILFFDEPFSALDPLIRKDMQNELLRLQATAQRTIVFITHDFDEALRLGDRIAIMKDGVVDQIGTPEEIVAAPATEYVRRFTTDVPKMKVLTARSVLTSGTAPPGALRVPSTATVGSCLAPLLAHDSPIGVMDDDGTDIGVVCRDKVAALMAQDSA